MQKFDLKRKRTETYLDVKTQQTFCTDCICLVPLVGLE